jgi:hypothetical protein
MSAIETLGTITSLRIERVRPGSKRMGVSPTEARRRAERAEQEAREGKEPSFPLLVKTSQRCAGFFTHEIDRYLQRVKDARDRALATPITPTTIGPEQKRSRRR